MSKLTKAQRREIQGALDYLKRGIAFLESDRISICVRDRSPYPIALNFIRAAPVPAILFSKYAHGVGDYSLCEISKFAGSDLAFFSHVREVLERMLSDASPAVEGSS